MEHAAQKTGPGTALAGMMICVVALSACGVVAGVSAARPGFGWSSLSLHSSHLVVALLGFLFFYALPSERVRKIIPGLLIILFTILAAILISMSDYRGVVFGYYFATRDIFVILFLIFFYRVIYSFEI